MSFIVYTLTLLAFPVVAVITIARIMATPPPKKDEHGPEDQRSAREQ